MFSIHFRFYFILLLAIFPLRSIKNGQNFLSKLNHREDFEWVKFIYCIFFLKFTDLFNDRPIER